MLPGAGGGGSKVSLDIFIPIAVLSVLALMIVPLPSWVLDILLIVDIIASILIILMAIYVKSPLDFSVFPTIILVETLYRLGLNVAATRLVLVAGHIKDPVTGDPIGAGKVIPTFAKFVAQGNLVIGFVIFLILIVVQFIVITQGAERIAQVAARFTLDAMPGKQMAIDADLHAGLITPDEARKRRSDIQREADFYGAMDGAGKFVKGDTIANIIILVINIIGGLLMGIIYHHMNAMDALQTYTILTIGNGLVTALPSFLISTAMGIIVSRAASESNLGVDVIQQLTGQPKALKIAAGAAAFLGVLSLLGMGLPKLPLFGFAALLWFLASKVQEKEVQVQQVQQEAKKEEKKEEAKKPENVMAYLRVEPLSVELGKGLLPLVDPSQGAKLLERVVSIRKHIAKEIGIIVPGIQFRDNLNLKPNTYVINIKDVKVAEGEVMINQFLAIGPENVLKQLRGTRTVDPAYGMPAVWIEPQDKAEAERLGCMLFDAVSVIATHLTEVIRNNAAELLGRQEVSALIDMVKRSHPAVVKDLIPDVVSIGEVQKILQNLVRERVPIKDLVTILEAIGDNVKYTKDPDELTEFVRQALARVICRDLANQEGVINAVALDPQLEQLIASNIQRTEMGSFLTLDPQIGQQIIVAVAEQIKKLTDKGLNPVIITSPQVRRFVRKLIERNFPEVYVISYNEIAPKIQVKTVGMVTLTQETQV